MFSDLYINNIIKNVADKDGVPPKIVYEEIQKVIDIASILSMSENTVKSFLRRTENPV